MQIVLKNNLFSVGILPDCGGSLSFFKRGTQDILRPASENETEANNTSLFVMLPYCSFIKNNHFPYFGITRNIQKNSGVSPFAIHGDIWRSKGEIVSQSETQVKLKFVHLKNQGFPFNYTAHVTYELFEEGLNISLQLENNSSLPMPYGMGIHPFFNRQRRTLLKYQSSHLWYREDDPIMGHPYTIPKELDFKDFKILPKGHTDISVSGWDGVATIQSDEFNLEIHSDLTFRHLNLFAPKNKKYFSVEPVTNTPDAFNLAALGIMGTGIQSLGPKETAQTKIQLYVKGK